MKDQKKQTLDLYRSHKSYLVVLLIALFMLLPFFPSLSVVFIGLMPTLVAFSTQPSYKACCVAFMNFSGVSPMAVELISYHLQGKDMFPVITHPLMWFFCLFFSGIGLVIANTVPNIAKVALKNSLKSKVTLLETKKNKITDKWLPDDLKK